MFQQICCIGIKHYPFLGRFYDLILDLGNTEKAVKGIRGWLDEGYITKLQHGDLSIKIYEWRNGLALDNFLDFIEIGYKGLPVYKANVFRYDSATQDIHVFNRNEDWQIKIARLLLDYGCNV